MLLQCNLLGTACLDANMARTSAFPNSAIYKCNMYVTLGIPLMNSHEFFGNYFTYQTVLTLQLEHILDINFVQWIEQ